MASPVFRAMFSTDMMEASKNSVEIVDLDPTILELLLSFMYNRYREGEEWSNWDWKNGSRVSQLIDACEKYGMKELKDICFKNLGKELDLDNVGEVAVLMHMYNSNSDFKEFVYNFIIK